MIKRRTILAICAAALAALVACSTDKTTPETPDPEQEQKVDEEEPDPEPEPEPEQEPEPQPRTNYAEFKLGDKVYPIAATDFYDWSNVDNCIEMWFYADANLREYGDSFYGSMSSIPGEFKATEDANWIDFYSAETFDQGSMKVNKWGNFWDSFTHKVTAIDLNAGTISAECSWKVWDAEDEYLNKRAKEDRIIETVTGVLVDYHFTFSQH